MHFSSFTNKQHRGQTASCMHASMPAACQQHASRISSMKDANRSLKLIIVKPEHHLWKPTRSVAGHKSQYTLQSGRGEVILLHPVLQPSSALRSSSVPRSSSVYIYELTGRVPGVLVPILLVAANTQMGTLMAVWTGRVSRPMPTTCQATRIFPSCKAWISISNGEASPPPNHLWKVDLPVWGTANPPPI